ncbi:ABC transporter substrate-binding protein [Roseibium sp. Sym1]|uniref:ABC transporter substrate-binding protein n=1 Tax=Roseibium sp. Sym1 TaxID=3016006 RepID=UPI0022B4AB98|nr:ABC transporter substrate-binding protein [Roseibium sp. Sym1]
MGSDITASQRWFGNAWIVRRCLFVMSTLVFALSAGPSQAGDITVYSATDISAFQPLIDSFERIHPGQKILYREFDTRDLFEIVAADEAGDADVVISSATDLQVALVNQGRALPFRLDGEDALPAWARWRNELYGFTFEPVAVIYNKAAFDGRALPRNRSDLASSIRDNPDFFAGRIGSYDIGQSGVGYMFATQDLQRGYEFWRLVETFGRAGLRTFCCTSRIFDAVASGDLVYAYNVIGPYALASARKTSTVGVYTLDDYTFVSTRTAFVRKEAPNKAGGIDFVSYLLSPEGQSELAASSPFLPVSVDIGKPLDKVIAFGNPEAMAPIKVGPGLIAYLDRMKREKLLADWLTAIDPSAKILQ